MIGLKGIEEDAGALQGRDGIVHMAGQGDAVGRVHPPHLFLDVLAGMPIDDGAGVDPVHDLEEDGRHLAEVGGSEVGYATSRRGLRVHRPFDAKPTRYRGVARGLGGVDHTSRRLRHDALVLPEDRPHRRQLSRQQGREAWMVPVFELDDVGALDSLVGVDRDHRLITANAGCSQGIDISLVYRWS